jgi:hypothetical protein
VETVRLDARPCRPNTQLKLRVAKSLEPFEIHDKN